MQNVDSVAIADNSKKSALANMVAQWQYNLDVQAGSIAPSSDQLQTLKNSLSSPYGPQGHQFLQQIQDIADLHGYHMSIDPNWDMDTLPAADSPAGQTPVAPYQPTSAGDFSNPDTWTEMLNQVLNYYGLDQAVSLDSAQISAASQSQMGQAFALAYPQFFNAPRSQNSGPKSYKTTTGVGANTTQNSQQLLSSLNQPAEDGALPLDQQTIYTVNPNTSVWGPTTTVASGANVSVQMGVASTAGAKKPAQGADSSDNTYNGPSDFYTTTGFSSYTEAYDSLLSYLESSSSTYTGSFDFLAFANASDDVMLEMSATIVAIVLPAVGSEIQTYSNVIADMGANSGALSEIANGFSDISAWCQDNSSSTSSVDLYDFLTSNAADSSALKNALIDYGDLSSDSSTWTTSSVNAAYESMCDYAGNAINTVGSNLTNPFASGSSNTGSYPYYDSSSDDIIFSSASSTPDAATANDTVTDLNAAAQSCSSLSEQMATSSQSLVTMYSSWCQLASQITSTYQNNQSVTVRNIT